MVLLLVERAAIVEHLRKTESCATKLIGLAQQSDDTTSLMGLAFSEGVIDLMHKAALAWSVVSARAAPSQAAFICGKSRSYSRLTAR